VKLETLFITQSILSTKRHGRDVNTPASYSGIPRFQSRHGDRLFWMFFVFLSLSTKIPGWYFKLGHGCFLPSRFQFTIHLSPIIRRYVVWVTENALSNKLQKNYPLHSHHHTHHHWLDSPTWALAFLRSFCQLKYLANDSSDFVTRVFSKVELSAPRPIPG
jgi:hypothetical protein